MWKRILTALIGIPLLAFVVFCNAYYDVAFFIIMLICGLLAQSEYLKIISRDYPKFYWTVTMAFSGILGLGFFLESLQRYFAMPAMPYISFALIIIGLSYFIFQIFTDNLKYSVKKISYHILGLFYVSFSFYHIILLHALPDGAYYVFLLIGMIWTGDGAAYFAGRLFGKHPLKPKISPKKTWEGTIANALFCILGAWLINLLFSTGWRINLSPVADIHFSASKGVIPFWLLAPLALVLNILGQFGDLTESMIKRDYGVKDSGTLLPGHGGLLDRIDSLLFALPVLYYALQLLDRFGVIHAR